MLTVTSGSVTGGGVGFAMAGIPTVKICGMAEPGAGGQSGVDGALVGHKFDGSLVAI